jgi:hypothetical protein
MGQKNNIDRSETALGTQSSANSPWSRLLLDAFQSGMRSSYNSGAANNSCMGFNGSGLGVSNGSAKYAGSGQVYGNVPQFNGGAMRSIGAQGGNLNALFTLAGDLGSNLGEGKHGSMKTVLGVLPKFNQLMRSGLSLPLDSSAGIFSLSYKDWLSGNGGSPSASYNSTHWKVGKIDFSAAASVGQGSGGGGSTGSSSFGSSAGGMAGGSSGGQSGDTGGGAAGGRSEKSSNGLGNPSSGGGKNRPAATLSLHLNF